MTDARGETFMDRAGLRILSETLVGGADVLDEVGATAPDASLEITRRLAGSPTLSQAQRTQLQSGRNALLGRAAKESLVAHSQSRLLGGLNRITGGTYLLHGLAASPSDKIQGTNLFARGGRVLGKVPYAGAVLTAGQAAWDIRHGKPADQALDSVVISTGVGAGVTGAMLAAAPIALAGGPFTLAAVGVGAAAAWGVGYVVDNHWNDIKDFSGDTVEAVGGGVATAARTVGGWLGG